VLVAHQACDAIITIFVPPLVRAPDLVCEGSGLIM
jgi:hypothetical protein